jgi:threonine synthase
MPFQCSNCGREEQVFRDGCSLCGGVIIHRPDFDGGKYYDPAAVGVWHYWRLLPDIPAGWRISLGEGDTFLQRADRLAAGLGLRWVFLKNEATNPSGSFVDRGVAVEISKASSLGFRKLSCFSRGNLGVSLSAYGAKVGLETHVYTPPTIERGKLYQLIAYDANVSFCKRLSHNQVKHLRHQGFYHVTSTSPYFLAGLKTIAYELAAQINPNYVIFPVGEGGNISMFWEGLKDLKRLGLAELKPRLVAVQSEGCMPIVKAFNRGDEQVVWRGPVKTIFGDIAVPSPSLGRMVLRALRESGGLAVAVSDRMILDATRDLARWEGLLAEPAAASTIAALRKMVENGSISRDDTVVCMVTGSGLKEPYLGSPIGRGARSIAARARASSRIGITKSHILKLLVEKPSHGYEIKKKLAERFGIKISTASVYQHLMELTDAGLLSPTPDRSNTRKRVNYTLTSLGRRAIQ